MAATRCIKCLTPLDGGQYCDDCKPEQPPRATPTAMNVMSVCPTCGRALESGTKFCWACDHQSTPEVEYGGFWIRAVAWVIDWTILSLFNMLVSAATSSYYTGFYVQMGAALVYFVGFWTAEGATPGKMIFGLKVRTPDNQPIGIGAGVLRFFGYYVSSLIFLMGYIMVAFTAEKRGLHDFIANTVVVMERDEEAPESSIEGGRDVIS